MNIYTRLTTLELESPAFREFQSKSIKTLPHFDRYK